jgi:hypothetical protein
MEHQSLMLFDWLHPTRESTSIAFIYAWKKSQPFDLILPLIDLILLDASDSRGDFTHDTAGYDIFCGREETPRTTN